MTHELEKIIGQLKSATHEGGGSAFEELAKEAYTLGQQNPGPTRYVRVCGVSKPGLSVDFWKTMRSLYPEHWRVWASSEYPLPVSSTDWQLIQQIPGWKTQLREVK